jgi:hypothetical protein
LRYRATSDLNDFSRDVGTVVDFIGRDEYRESLKSIQRSLNSKGFVTGFDDQLFGLELDLFNLELLRQENGGMFNSLPEVCHAGMDFLIGLGQTIDHLSTSAKTRLLGRIRKGLKEGLWPLQHEFRIAAILSKLGWDIYFHDLEEDGGYDFLATKNGKTFEVEAKAISLFTAWPIKPDDVAKLVVELKQHFSWSDSNSIPLLVLNFTSKLSAERTQLRELVSVMNEVVRTRQEIFLPGVKVRCIGTVPHLPNDGAFSASGIYHVMTDKGIATVVIGAEAPRFVLELNSKKRIQLARRMLRTIREAAKEQFSQRKPGVIWMHIGMITDELFKVLSAGGDANDCVLDRIALAALLSNKRNHLSQLVFSGGSSLKKTVSTMFSSYETAVYDSPHCRFGSTVLFECRRKQLSRMLGTARRS